jgi:hypothetical protein
MRSLSSSTVCSFVRFPPHTTAYFSTLFFTFSEYIAVESSCVQKTLQMREVDIVHWLSSSSRCHNMDTLPIWIAWVLAAAAVLSWVKVYLLSCTRREKDVHHGRRADTSPRTSACLDMSAPVVRTTQSGVHVCPSHGTVADMRSCVLPLNKADLVVTNADSGVHQESRSDVGLSSQHGHETAPPVVTPVKVSRVSRILVIAAMQLWIVIVFKIWHHARARADEHMLNVQLLREALLKSEELAEAAQTKLYENALLGSVISLCVLIACTRMLLVYG